MIKNLILMVGTMLLMQQLHAQDQRRYTFEKGDVKISGTSSLHDWEMDVQEVSGQFMLKSEEELIPFISGLDLRLNSTAIVSGNGIMDNKTRKALKADKYPEIRFSSEKIGNLEAEAGAISGWASGTLEISGSKRRISFPFKASTTAEGFIITGSYSLKMTDFGIDPPTAMMGSLKTGDEVKVIFNTVWESRSGLGSLP